MADQAESSRRAPPMTPPSSPTIPEDSSSEAILWPASDDCSYSTPHTDLFSLWLSNYTALPQPEGEEEPLADVPTLLNFNLETSFPDLVDRNTTSIAVTQAPVVTQPLWMQLQAPAEGEVDNLSQLAPRIQSPKSSILPLALRIKEPEAFISPLVLRIQDPKAFVSPLELGIQSPPASSEIEAPQASLSPLALGLQSPPASFGIQPPPASFSSLPPIPCTLPMAKPLWNLPSIPCSLPMAPPLGNLPSIPCTLPMAPPLWNFLPCSFPVVEHPRCPSVLPSTPPPAWRQPVIVSSPFSHPSHQTHHFFPGANTGYQQQVPVADAPVTFSTPNANADINGGFVPASRPSWSQVMAPRGSWTQNQPWMNSGQDMKLPIPRRPRFLLPPAATVSAPPSLLANFGSSVGNMPSSNARGDFPVEDHQRVQLGESSRPQKRSKLALDPSGSEASHCSQDGTEVASIAREKYAFEPALNTNGKPRALPGTATDPQSMFARCKREQMKQRMKILQRLIPNGDKVDMGVLLEQTYIYIKFLEQQIKFLKSSMD